MALIGHETLLQFLNRKDQVDSLTTSKARVRVNRKRQVGSIVRTTVDPGLFGQRHHAVQDERARNSAQDDLLLQVRIEQDRSPADLFLTKPERRLYPN